MVEGPRLGLVHHCLQPLQLYWQVPRILFDRDRGLHPLVVVASLTGGSHDGITWSAVTYSSAVVLP